MLASSAHHSEWVRNLSRFGCEERSRGAMHQERDSAGDDKQMSAGLFSSCGRFVSRPF